MKIPTLLALACAVAIAIPLRMAGADPEGYPSGKPFQAIEADFDSLQEAVDGLSGDLQSLSQALTVEVTVDTEVCIPFPVQCGSNPAFDNGVAANNGNANPVHLVATVSRGGVPVTGLTLADFQFIVGTVPAGGSALVFCDAVDCTENNFGEAGTGVYRMFLVTFDLSDWDDGVYTGALSVTDPEGGNGFALVSLTIPPI
jgi:hypothetical protein